MGDYPDTVNIIKSAREVNDSMPDFVISRIKELMKENNIEDISRVGLYGVTYKEDVDYEANSIKIYDPFIRELHWESQYLDFEKFINDIDMIVIMVGHAHIKEMRNIIKNKLILDTKNIIKDCEIYKL